MNPVDILDQCAGYHALWLYINQPDSPDIKKLKADTAKARKVLEDNRRHFKYLLSRQMTDGGSLDDEIETGILNMEKYRHELPLSKHEDFDQIVNNLKILLQNKDLDKEKMEELLSRLENLINSARSSEQRGSIGSNLQRHVNDLKLQKEIDELVKAQIQAKLSQIEFQHVPSIIESEVTLRQPSTVLTLFNLL